MTVNIFEQATRKKLRFSTRKGEASVEDLWDLSLTALNEVAKGVNRTLKAQEEEDFITTPSTAATTDQLKLDILKSVIKHKLEVKDATAKRQETLQKKAQLEQIIMRKKDAELEGKSLEDLQKELAELS